MKEKILIAFSDPALASTLAARLGDKGYVVTSAINGDEALKVMRTTNPNLVLIDPVLPGKSGYEVLTEKTLDRMITKIPVIVISNSGTPLEMRLIPSTGSIKDYIIKMYIDVDEVIEKVKNILNDTVSMTTPSPAPASAPAPAPKTNKTVLWVEDDKFLSMILLKKFETFGYAVLKGTNGDEALKFLLTETPDIIILDILLPGMNGLDLLQKIKMNEKARHIPVIILSNMSKQSDIEKAKMLGAQKFLVKAAVSLDEIIKEVKSLTHS